MIKFYTFALLVAVLGLTGCAAATPLLVVEAGSHQLAMYDEDLKVRAAAALQEEPDLLTFSVQAIMRGRTQVAADTYQKGYQNPEFSDAMRSLALYQMALLYMNRFNEDRNDALARQYLLIHREDFPNSLLQTKIEHRLAILDQRQKEPVQLTAQQLLRQVDRSQLLKRNDIPFDSELTPMSERAIVDGRVDDAERVYLILYANTASSDDMRARALYQLGLIFMSPYNDYNDPRKAIGYFRQITNEFPNATIAPRAQYRISQIINQQ
ncbi:MAG: hypothetical protein IBX52_06785 [Bacterioplanes sp.]|nr:hypothetical protein [Bacterioplanes sp.]